MLGLYSNSATFRVCLVQFPNCAAFDLCMSSYFKCTVSDVIWLAESNYAKLVLNRAVDQDRSKPRAYTRRKKFSFLKKLQGTWNSAEWCSMWYVEGLLQYVADRQLDHIKNVAVPYRKIIKEYCI
jgi:hypothetical protein